ncbi:MAG: hypothetical protein HC910_18475 [Spirulinaceae cyanobacterium SM2_1_0]|nr:hypothetical protein [Spirulinaceae cyanobacterium SM2_1_0]
MNNTKLLTGTLASALGVACLAVPLSTEASVYRDGWYYSIDPSHDSVAFNFETNELDIGNSIYEIYGMAMKENPETGEIWVAINSNLPLTGRNVPTVVNDFPVPDGNIGWGDLWFDFSGTGNFEEAFAADQMYGVRFADTNDSGVSAGVYQAVQGTSVASTNAGYWNLRSYNDQIFDARGLNSWMGDKRWNDPYYDPYTDYTTADGQMPNVIESGQRIGDVTIRTEEELAAQGFSTDLFFQTAADMIAFSFAKPAGFVGNFVATILQECLNDSMALLGSFPPVPQHQPDPDPDPDPTPVPVDECEVSFSQLEALAPDEVDGDWKIFYDTLSNQWYDPPVYTGFEFEALDGTSFKQLLDFPCGIVTEDEFKVSVEDADGNLTHIFTKLGPGDSLSFEDYFDEPVTRFTISEKTLISPAIR